MRRASATVDRIVREEYAGETAVSVVNIRTGHTAMPGVGGVRAE
ncbi:hypothetical protein [Kribbella jiaozuonensis]|nr:hypothetical protein [Kribbella jiaozuonensis]